MIDESEIRRRLDEEAHSCYRWSNGPGTAYGSHSHGYRKILYCVSGSIRFDIHPGGEGVELGPGDRLELPPNTEHSAVVGGQGVSCIEGQAR